MAKNPPIFQNFLERVMTMDFSKYVGKTVSFTYPQAGQFENTPRIIEVQNVKQVSHYQTVTGFELGKGFRSFRSYKMQNVQVH